MDVIHPIVIVGQISYVKEVFFKFARAVLDIRAVVAMIVLETAALEGCFVVLVLALQGKSFNIELFTLLSSSDLLFFTSFSVHVCKGRNKG